MYRKVTYNYASSAREGRNITSGGGGGGGGGGEIACIQFSI